MSFWSRMAAQREIIAAAIAPLYWISCPLGVLPVKFDGRRFSTSRRLKIYSNLVCILIAAVELYHLQNIITSRIKKAMTGESILVVVSYLVGNTIIILNIFYVVVLREKLISILNQLDLAAVALRRSIQVNFLLWRVRVFVICLQVLTTLIYFYLKVEEFHFDRGFSLKSVCHWAFVACRICGKTTTMCTGAHFCVLCIIIAALIEATNRELRIWFEATKVPGRKNQASLAERMIKLRILHANLYFTAERVIGMYGLYVLLNLVYVNIFFQTSAFNIISKAYKTIFLEHVTWNHTLSYNLYWIVVDVIKAGVYFYAATFLAKEVGSQHDELLF
jgi:hypothetical protein